MNKIKKILLLDNNDSFTYNIVDYIRRIENIELSVIKTSEVKIDTMGNYDKFIISPGPGLPNNYPNIQKLLEKYYSSKHILGVCLGHQAIGQFYSSKLTNISPVIHGQSHKINIIKNTPIFQELPKTFDVGLYHSWIIDNGNFSDELEIIAVNNKNYIMAIQSKYFPIYGLQFHPESFITEYGFQILKNFIELKYDK